MSRRKKRSPARQNHRPSGKNTPAKPAPDVQPPTPVPAQGHKGLLFAAAVLQAGWLAVLLTLALQS